MNEQALEQELLRSDRWPQGRRMFESRAGLEQGCIAARVTLDLMAADESQGYSEVKKVSGVVYWIGWYWALLDDFAPLERHMVPSDFAEWVSLEEGFIRGYEDACADDVEISECPRMIANEQIEAVELRKEELLKKFKGLVELKGHQMVLDDFCWQWFYGRNTIEVFWCLRFLVREKAEVSRAGSMIRVCLPKRNWWVDRPRLQQAVDDAREILRAHQADTMCTPSSTTRTPS